MVLEAIRYSSGKLTILDQLLLPHQEAWMPIRSSEEAWHAVRNMNVRGAPAIAIVAALAVAVEDLGGAETAVEARDAIVHKLDYLVTSRPTAVNLSDAVAKLTRVVGQAADAHNANGPSVQAAYIKAAEQMLVDDVSDNTNIGEHGAKWILNRAGSARKISVMTHCNTGSLATAGYGTALGIIRSLQKTGRLDRVYYGETRPYNQGARLTGFELLHDGIPATLVTDSMAGALMAHRGPHKRAHAGRLASHNANDGKHTQSASGEGNDEETKECPLLAVIVGADRVAANGDTANKIGTYGLSVLAKHHGVLFVVAAPRTTIDLKTKTGADIVIEERNQNEVTIVKGPTVKTNTGDSHGGSKLDLDLNEVKQVSIAPSSTRAWNPSFDVTPAELIDAIVTEVGVAQKSTNGFDMAHLFDASAGK